ncbi:ATP-grasp domain-containing protein [Actinosynnema sp. NPDC020468]|uniref:ATP-grasp domain-containing protein n=1 Tax=Actinosynnema sp. NPDC020468 TaxID=3154488 RepID=UPI0033F7CFFA
MTAGNGSEPGTLLIIGGRLQAVEKAKALGLRVVLLQHRERLQPGQAEAADALLLIDYLDWELTRPIVVAAHEAYRFTAVVTLVEQATELAGRINDVLGLPGTSYEVARRFHDKLGMRERLHAVGFESVAAAPVASAEDIRAFGSRHGYPVVVKPTDGTGSRGAALVDAEQDAEPVWDRLASLRERGDLPMATFYPLGEFMAEEYVEGPEYSVESFSFKGNHVVLAVTEKTQSGFTEVGHAQPAPLTGSDERAVVDHTAGFLTAMGLLDGVGHTEIRLSADGPRIIEGHDRVAGDRIMDLVEAVYGVDIERYAVGWPTGRLPEIAERPAPRGAAATRFLTAEPGVVAAVHGVEEVRAHPGVLDLDVSVAVGDVVERMDDNFGRHAQLLVTAKDTASAVELCESLLSRIRVVPRAATD